MSDKLKRVLDTNLAGLHVTDAQVNAVLRRVSQDEKRPRVIRWQAIAAVLLVLVLGAGVLLQTGILSDDSPQLTADVKNPLILYYYQDMNLQETADALGISKSTVHTRLKKAEQALKLSLTGGDCYV